MEDEDIQNMAYRIAEALNENCIDARRAEPILWMLLSNVYRLLKKKDGISTRDIASIIEDNKKVVDLKHKHWNILHRLAITQTKCRIIPPLCS
jgi:hypothetical protein